MHSLIARILDRIFRREIIGLRGEEPYLIRWIVYRRKSGAGLYIHLFIGDDTADTHDHPKRFTSIGLWGSYTEEVIEDVGFATRHRIIQYKAPWFRRFGPDHRHRLTLDSTFCWTLVKVGREVRDWGFYTPSGWVDWRDYEPHGPREGDEDY